MKKNSWMFHHDETSPVVTTRWRRSHHRFFGSNLRWWLQCEETLEKRERGELEFQNLCPHPLSKSFNQCIYWCREKMLLKRGNWHTRDWWKLTKAFVPKLTSCVCLALLKMSPRPNLKTWIPSSMVSMSLSLSLNRWWLHHQFTP